MGIKQVLTQQEQEQPAISPCYLLPHPRALLSAGVHVCQPILVHLHVEDPFVDTAQQKLEQQELPDSTRTWLLKQLHLAFKNRSTSESFSN